MPKISMLMIRQRIAVIWKEVLSFPPISAGITISFERATALSPVTRNSLTMMVMAIHAESLAISTRRMRADITRNLSAMGSRIIPNFVICPVFLAR